MTSIQLFDFKDKKIRAVYKDGEIWYVAKDVSEGLGIKWQGDKTLAGINEECKGVTLYATPGGTHETIIISEQAVYQLAFKSKKSMAKEFTVFMAGVAVRIRKGESVSLETLSPARALMKQIEQMVRHEDEIRELQTRTDIIESKLINRSEGYYTLAGWINLNKLKAKSSDELKVIGMRARRISDMMNIEIKSVSDEKWGKLNIYHEKILNQLGL